MKKKNKSIKQFLKEDFDKFIKVIDKFIRGFFVGIKGIRGWLIILTIFLFIGAGSWVINLYLFGLALFSNMVGLNILFFLISAIMSFIAIYSLVLEFKKKKEFPKWVMALLWGGIITSVLVIMLGGDYTLGIITSGLIIIKEIYVDIRVNLFWVLIWTWYLNVSVRVKNTFVK